MPRLTLIAQEKKLLHNATESKCRHAAGFHCSRPSYAVRRYCRHLRVRRWCLPNISSVATFLGPLANLQFCLPWLAIPFLCLPSDLVWLALPESSPWSGAAAPDHQRGLINSSYLPPSTMHGIQCPFPIFCSMLLMATGSHPCVRWPLEASSMARWRVAVYSLLLSKHLLLLLHSFMASCRTDHAISLFLYFSLLYFLCRVWFPSSPWQLHISMISSYISFLPLTKVFLPLI